MKQQNLTNIDYNIKDNYIIHLTNIYNVIYDLKMCSVKYCIQIDFILYYIVLFVNKLSFKKLKDF